MAASLSLLLSTGGIAQAQTVDTCPVAKDPAMTSRALGSFDVKLTPQTDADPAIGRLTIDKQFHGDLEGTSVGVMIASSSSVPGSAGYVALERVTGTLAGRSGSFVLQHSGTMNRGAAHLVITVVPDSGTDGLAGLSGTMSIIITGGKHSYEFDYEFAPPS